MTFKSRSLAIVCGSVVTLTGCAAETTPTTTPSATPEATPLVNSGAPTPTAEPTTLEISWSDSRFDGDVGAAIADRGSFLAVSTYLSQRLVWSSPDGNSWNNTTAPAPAPSDCEFPEPRCFANAAGLGQLVRLGDTLYSFGTACCFNDYLRPVAWRHTDGQDWEAVQSKSDFFAYGGVIDVAAGDDALVASTTNSLGLTSGVWRWTSESSWEATELVGTPSDPLSADDIAWSHGSFVALGATYPDAPAGGQRTLPALWASSDGLSWSPISPPPDATELCSVTGTTAGFVMLGSTETGMAAWTAFGSGEWVRSDIPSDPIPAAEPTGLREKCGVVELDHGLLAFRAIEDGTLIWTSIDGASWDPAQTLDVITGPDLVTAVGNRVALFGHPPGNVRWRLFIGTVDR